MKPLADTSPAGELQTLLASRVAMVVIESREEGRVMELVREAALKAQRGKNWGVFQWTVTEGLLRVDVDLGGSQKTLAQPEQLLKHIRATTMAGIYVLLDFHPYLENPMFVRTIKDIAQDYKKCARTLVLISHEVKLPQELDHLAARFTLRMPDKNERHAIVMRMAREWAQGTGGMPRVDLKVVEKLVDNLAGLPLHDVERLTRQAIFNDGALTEEDLRAAAGGEIPAAEPRRHAVVRAGHREVRRSRRAQESAALDPAAQGGLRRHGADARRAQGRVVVRRAGLRQEPRGARRGRRARRAAGAPRFRRVVFEVARRIGEEPARIAVFGRGAGALRVVAR